MDAKYSLVLSGALGEEEEVQFLNKTHKSGTRWLELCWDSYKLL